ncbi:TfuA-like protein [Legionella pneumophila]|nr:TfuA-like protein [Legionella pneumophila]
MSSLMEIFLGFLLFGIRKILTALDYGLEVFGAASMGALRAAELDAFGMKGYGRIYEMYKNEEIDGDDEVAIAYSKYNNEQTIPLINIRLTLERINITNKETILDSIDQYFMLREHGVGLPTGFRGTLSFN